MERANPATLEPAQRHMPIHADIVQALIDALEYFEDRQDADCVGDPLEFVPNKEMQLAAACSRALELAGVSP